MNPNAKEYNPFTLRPFPRRSSIPQTHRYCLYSTEKMIYSINKSGEAVLDWKKDRFPAVILFRRALSPSQHTSDIEGYHLIAEFKYHPSISSITLEVEGCNCPFEDICRGKETQLDTYTPNTPQVSSLMFVFPKCSCSQRFIISQEF